MPCHLALEPYERLLVVVGRSPSALVGPAVRLMIIGAASCFVASRSGRWLISQPGLVLPCRIAIFLVAGALALRWVVRSFRAWSGQLCALTTHRIVIRYSRKGPAAWSIPYGTITSVVCVKTPGRNGWQGLRANSLRIETTLSPFPARLPNVANAKSLAAAVAAIGHGQGADVTDLRSQSAAGYR